MQKRLKVLFVEDDRVDQTAFARLVERENLPYDYVMADSVSDAREALAAQSFDLVLMDYLLGAGTAINLFDQVEDAPIIVITGGGDEEVAVHAMKAGAYDYLIKDPAGNYLTTLPLTVERAMQHKEAQEELRQYRERLEELVEERTAELTRTNEQLRAAMAERTRAQEALRVAEQDQQIILDGLSELVTYYHDVDLKIVWANRAASESVALPADELVGRHCYGVWHGRDRPCVDCPVVKVFETGQPQQGEATSPDGRHWIVSGRPVVGEDGSVTGVVEATLEITERVRAEEALRQERDKVQEYLDIAGVIILVIGADRKVQLVNRKGCEVLGYGQEEITGSDWFENYLLEEDRERAGAFFQAEIDGEPEQPADNEDYVLTSTGESRLIAWHNTLLRDDSGKTIGTLSSGEDITEQRQAEEALARERNLLRTLIDILPDPIYVKDMESRFLAGNAAVARMMGAATPDDLQGKTDFDFYPHELGVEFHADEREVLESGQPLLNKEEPCVDPEGVTHRILTTKVPLRDAQGNTVGLVGIGRDVTERVRAEEALRTSEERFAVAFRSNPNAVAINYLETGRYVDVNDSFVSMYGYDRDEVIGHTPLELKLWKEPEQRDELMRTLREQGVVRDFQFAFRPKSGPVGTARLSAGLIELGGEPCILAVTNDITEQIRLEEQLRQAQRMEAVGQLTGGIAHDFNNLLTAILGFTHLMQSQLSPEDPLYEFTDRILHSGERAASLTSQLLAFSRKQIIQPRVLDLNAVIPDMDQMLQRVIGEDVELRTVLAPDLWPVKMDPAQVEQVIVNIAVNARHAMPRGGQLTIEVANAVLDEDAVADRPETEPGEYVQLAITDTGVGMSDEVMAQIFEPFFTTREVGQGTGLGLSTVYGIVKQNHGDIWVHSQVGQGTTLKIYIPRARQATPSPSDRDQAADLPRGTETVLVVEDDPNVRDLIAGMLRMQGYTVLQATNAREALRLADEHGGGIHLLLSDLVLPGMNGIELAGRLAATNPGIKVLLTSGYTADVIERHGMPTHGIPFIEKPFSPSDMARKVRDVLDE